MSSLDSLITSDLASLGEDSRRDTAALDDTLNAKNMYRDDRPGAEARRDALAEDRRVELAMMPLAMSQVFAHRVGRGAVGAVACLGTIVSVAILADPVPLQYATWLVPNLARAANLQTLAMVALVVLLAVYVVSVRFAEAWFARRMREAIQTGSDPYGDLDALARGPFETARQALHRIDGLSLGLFFVGTTSLTLVAGYTFVIIDAFYGVPAAWIYSGNTLHAPALVDNLEVLAVSLLGVVAAGVVIGRACQSRVPSRLLAMLGHWSTLGLAIAAGSVTAYAALGTLARFSMGTTLPPLELRYALALGITIAFVAAGAWKLLWWRRREHARIGE